MDLDSPTSAPALHVLACRHVSTTGIKKLIRANNWLQVDVI